MTSLTTLSNGDFYVIAEIGINHNGSVDEAIWLMQEAKRAGAHAVKFQKRNLEAIYVPELLNDPNSAEWSFQYLLPQLYDLEFGDDTFSFLRETARGLDVDFIVTPFDHVSAKLVTTLDVSAVKISSADLTNWPLVLDVLRGFTCPVLFSTGMWDDAQIRKSAAFIQKNAQQAWAMLLCQSTYPAPIDALNLRYLHKIAGMAPMIGYSGHEREVDASILAYALGAQIIEKHITRDASQLGPDHKASLTPDKFANLVDRLTQARTMLGREVKVVTMAERLNKEVFAKSIVPVRDLVAGEVLKIEDVRCMSPGKGITPDRMDEFLGRTLARAKKKDAYISEQDFEERQGGISDWEAFAFKRDWGVKCRFHDFDVYKTLKTPVIEFHCSDRDILEGREAKSVHSALIMHAPEIIGRDLFDLCSDDPEVVRRSADLLGKTLERARELAPGFKRDAAPKIVLHVGGMSLRGEGFDCAEMTRKAEKSLCDLDLTGIDLLPENLPPRPWYLGGQWHQYGFMRPEDMAAFCKSLSLGMTFDICHAQLYCAYAGISLTSYFKLVMPYVRHVHISDASGIDGEGVQVGEGELDFDALFRAMEKARFSWVPEIWSGHVNNGAGTHRALCCLHKYAPSGAL